MTDEARLERQKWDAEHLAAHAAAGPSLVGVGAEPANEEFGRFEDPTRQLAQTPKAACDGG